MTPAFLRASLEGYKSVLPATQCARGGASTPAVVACGMALQATGVMVGYIGFRTAPNAEYLQPYVPGGVENGLVVLPSFRRQGSAREAAVALMRWALLAHGVTRFAMTIRPDNHPSQALASQLGFVRIGSHIDEVDGLEDILECRLSVEDITKEDSEKLR